MEFDISGASSSGNITTALNTITGIVNNTANVTTGTTITPSWHSLQLLPQYSTSTGSQISSTQVYFTHRSAQSSTPLDFTLHEDSGTLGKLKLTPKSYDKDSTVKAQLEDFLYDSMIYTSLNVFESLDTNQQLSLINIS